MLSQPIGEVNHFVTYFKYMPNTAPDPESANMHVVKKGLIWYIQYIPVSGIKTQL